MVMQLKGFFYAFDLDQRSKVKFQGKTVTMTLTEVHGSVKVTGQGVFLTKMVKKISNWPYPGFYFTHRHGTKVQPMEEEILRKPANNITHQDFESIKQMKKRKTM